MGYAGVRPCFGAASHTAAAILTSNRGPNHVRMRPDCRVKARPPAEDPRPTAGNTRALLLLILAACGTPPQTEPQADTMPRADSQDTYIEGSQRVWDAARDRGVTFRAVGQEPGWLLEIQDDERMRLLTGYGVDTVVVPVPAPVIDAPARTTTYRAATQENDVVVTIREEPCFDAMSGERFSRTVDVVVNGTALHGCGRTLEPTRPTR